MAPVTMHAQLQVVVAVAKAVIFVKMKDAVRPDLTNVRARKCVVKMAIAARLTVSVGRVVVVVAIVKKVVSLQF